MLDRHLGGALPTLGENFEAKTFFFFFYLLVEMMILKVSAFGKLVQVGGEKNMMWET